MLDSAATRRATDKVRVRRLRVRFPLQRTKYFIFPFPRPGNGVVPWWHKDVTVNATVDRFPLGEQTLGTRQSAVLKGDSQVPYTYPATA